VTLKCNICGLATNSEKQLKQHIGSQHGHAAFETSREHYSSLAYDAPSQIENTNIEYTSSTEHSSNLHLQDEYPYLKKAKLSPPDEIPPTDPPSNVINFPPLGALYTAPDGTPPSTSVSPFACDICKVNCNSTSQFQAHLTSRAHLHRLEPCVYACELCNLGFNSTSQLQAHCTGIKHKDNMEKAYYSEYPFIPFLFLHAIILYQY
jgi:Zinc-finger of C2H2 type/Zinc-finger double-stranded RNA-binding